MCDIVIEDEYAINARQQVSMVDCEHFLTLARIVVARVSARFLRGFGFSTNVRGLTPPK